MCVGGNLVYVGRLDVACKLVLPYEEHMAFDSEDLDDKEFLVCAERHMLIQVYNWNPPGIVGVDYSEGHGVGYSQELEDMMVLVLQKVVCSEVPDDEQVRVLLEACMLLLVRGGDLGRMEVVHCNVVEDDNLLLCFLLVCAMIQADDTMLRGSLMVAYIAVLDDELVHA